MLSNRLTLKADGWYGWQMIHGYAGARNVPYFSPIRITRVTPQKTGKGILKLSFFNALYAEGVQLFELDIRILRHQQDYLIASLVTESPGPKGALL